MTGIAERLEYMAERDPFYNYCLWEYEPVAPYVGKYRSVNLLFHSFDLLGTDGRMFELVEMIRRAVGPSLTVWGVKRSGERMAWEFYFYDYRRRERQRSITGVTEAIAPLARCQIPVNEDLPYFMFSIDVDDDLISRARDISEIHMYLGNVGSTVSSGICYSLKAEGMRLENFYFFFNPQKQLDDVMGKVCCSPFVDFTKVNIDDILWPELVDCRTICIANKQRNDCAYFSGINVDQLLFFLRRMAYPDGVVSFVEENKARLDHLLYDVGVDYRMTGGEVELLKSGYYGIF